MEEWKPIRQNNNYMISNHGRVRSYNYHTHGKLLTLSQRMTLAQKKIRGTATQLVYAILCSKYSKVAVPVAYLVYEHFVGKIPDGYVVFNKDRNPWNNKVDNLMLIQSADNKLLKIHKTCKYVLKAKKDRLYEYYVDGECVGSVNDFIKIVGKQTKQNVNLRFTRWENRKKDSKWHMSEGVIFNGHVCTRKLKPAKNKKIKRLQNCLEIIKD